MSCYRRNQMPMVDSGMNYDDGSGHSAVEFVVDLLDVAFGRDCGCIRLLEDAVGIVDIEIVFGRDW